MPSKSRRRRGKYSTQSKKQSGASRPKAVAQQSAATQAREPAPLSSVTASPRPVTSRPAKATSSLVKPAAGRDRYVTTELRTIGILAGTMLIILVVLARIMS